MLIRGEVKFTENKWTAFGEFDKRPFKRGWQLNRGPLNRGLTLATSGVWWKFETQEDSEIYMLQDTVSSSCQLLWKEAVSFSGRVLLGYGIFISFIIKSCLRNFEPQVSLKFWQLLANYRRPKLTIRGIDQILNDLCTRIEWDGTMLHTGPLRIWALSSTKHCMEFQTTKDKIAQWNKMLHLRIKLRKFTHLVWFLLSIWHIWSFWGTFQMFVAASKVSKFS